ncbi:hypothetical protein DH2020_009438 [Rehmannia glutinosa]|uniref:Uncharacterized protein n=1 Tax=Rehmannia glutinosa TaxID=99300 RepID=A0ABR0X9I4_REHGL
MGNLWSAVEPPPPPPMVLVPPLFDFPPLAARTRMLESSYNLLFGKLALRCLFEDYFEEAKHFSTRIMLKPIDDPHVDLIASSYDEVGRGDHVNQPWIMYLSRGPFFFSSQRDLITDYQNGIGVKFIFSFLLSHSACHFLILMKVGGPLDHKPEEKIVGNAQFRWQSDVDDPHTFVDLFVSNTEPTLLMRSCAYYPKFGLGAFGIFPVLLKQRLSSEDYGVMGLRYGSSNLSVGATVIPFSGMSPHLICLVGSKEGAQYKNLANWSCAIGYGLGSGSPLSPSFNFGLELAKNSQVKNPLEENEVVGITNYIDFGFELQTRVDDNKSSNNIQDSTFQAAASWQANKNFLVKGKVGPLSSSIALAFKSWWKPSFTLSLSGIFPVISATMGNYKYPSVEMISVRDRTKAETSFGFGICVDNIREASYQRADPNFVMLTPNKEHLAEGIHWKIGKRPVLQSDVNSENFDGIPKELRPLNKIL